MSEEKTLVEVKHLKQYFDINMGMFKTKPLKAVDDISFTIKKGETLGLVGESGCGKTTAGRSILHLYKPTAGEVIFDKVLLQDSIIGKDPLDKGKDLGRYFILGRDHH